MALPGNWNSSTVRVDPWVLNSSAKNLKSAVQDIQNDLGDIITALNNLKITWTGDSASVAAEAAKRWTDVTTELYGPPNDPSRGILNVLTGGVTADAVNYSQCEGHVYDMFAQFETALGAKSTGSSASATQTNVTDNPTTGASRPPYHTTSVNETF